PLVDRPRGVGLVVRHRDAVEPRNLDDLPHPRRHPREALAEQRPQDRRPGPLEHEHVHADPGPDDPAVHEVLLVEQRDAEDAAGNLGDVHHGPTCLLRGGCDEVLIVTRVRPWLPSPGLLEGKADSVAREALRFPTTANLVAWRALRFSTTADSLA